MVVDNEVDDEEEAIRQAMLLSMGSVEAPASASADVNQAHGTDVDDEEEAMRQAMLLSMEADQREAVPAIPPASAVPPPVPPASSVFIDDDFASELLGSVGVDPNDPAIIAARDQLHAAGVKPPDSGKDGDKKDGERK